MLVTVYFREGQDGTLHRTQHWFDATFAPAEGVTQRVAQPFRDAAHWVSDISQARTQRDRLAAENARLRSQLASRELDHQLAAELEAELHYVQSSAFPHLGDYTPHAAEVIVRSPTLYSQKVLLDQGSNAGISVNDPVLSGVASQGYTGAALVGRVTAVTSSTAEVTLISDASMAVAASVAGRSGADGVLEPNAGDATTQVLDFVPKEYVVNNSDLVVTSGFVDPTKNLRSYFPGGIPIGLVTYVSQSDTENYKTIQVTPWVDLQAFRTALVLVAKGSG